MARTVHIVGAGLAGLAAAVRLAGQGIAVVLHEAANQAGGRCRSYHDPALDMTIDNGNHLVLSGNRATLDFVATIGARDQLRGPSDASFPMVDIATNERWTIRINEGRFPSWLFDRTARVPGTRVTQYLPLARLLWAKPDAAIGDVIACKGPVYERLIDPLLRAALNTEPPEASAGLAAAVLRETVAVGGRACHPLIAADGLATAFVEPAMKFVQQRGTDIHFGHRLRACTFDGSRVSALDFGEDAVQLAAEDAVIVAVPPPVASDLLPGLVVPTEFRAIVNAHYRIASERDLPPMMGAVNGTLEWLFAFRDRLSVTISTANRLLETERDILARKIWQEVARMIGSTAPLPPWQIVRERRATFAALPSQNARRPAAQTAWRNLVLAGDWTATGLPATIEGAIRSGNRAAELAHRITRSLG
jgi:squalene-associated FAD-dependent desaturase